MPHKLLGVGTSHTRFGNFTFQLLLRLETEDQAVSYFIFLFGDSLRSTYYDATLIVLFLAKQLRTLLLAYL